MRAPCGPEPAPPGRLIGGKLVEHVVSLRMALAALRFVADDPELFERFRRDVLTHGGELPLGASREVTELLTPGLLNDAVGLAAEALLLEGYQ